MGRRHRVRTDTRHWLTDSLFLFEELFEERNTRRPREVNKVFARGRRVETNKRSMLFLPQMPRPVPADSVTITWTRSRRLRPSAAPISSSNVSAPLKSAGA